MNQVKFSSKKCRSTILGMVYPKSTEITGTILGESESAYMVQVEKCGPFVWVNKEFCKRNEL